MIPFSSCNEHWDLGINAGFGMETPVGDIVIGAGFNKDLPMYVTENGVDYRVVYKLVEDDTSDAYVDTYRTDGITVSYEVTTDTTVDAGKTYYTRS